MHIELRHLRTVKTIHEAGGLARAAERMHITQSALSHQIKGLEGQVGMELFVRRSKPLRLSAAGFRILRLAEKVLPEVAATEEEFSGLHEGRHGRLHIAMECHACYAWLLPVLDQFRRAWPGVDMDIRTRLAFDAMPALMREEVDAVITSDPEPHPGVDYRPLFDYEPMFIAAASHPLSAQPFVLADDFASEILLTYPVEKTRLDVFTELLTPANVTPRQIRQVEVTAVMLLLVAAGQGVAVLPDWALRDVRHSPEFVTRPLTAAGRTRRMYVATRSEDVTTPYMGHFTRLARQEPVKLQR